VRLPLYILCGVGALGLLTAGVIYLRSETTPDAQGNRPPVTFDDPERRRFEELEVHREYLANLPPLKHQAVEAMLERRLSLLEAAAMFRKIHENNPGYLAHLRILFPNGSDTERYCRGVILYVSNRLDGKPEGAALVAQLEAELEFYLQRGLPPDEPLPLPTRAAPARQ
jgi:hypothetical protein